MSLDFNIEYARKALNDPDALQNAFVWGDTKQGHKFWERECYNKTLSPEAREILEKMIANHEAKEAPAMTAFEPGKEYKTRDGRKVRIYAVDAGGTYPIHGAIFDGEDWDAIAWMDNGRFSISSNETKCDIMPPEPEKVTIWVNVYPSHTIKLHEHKTREDADRNASSNRIACVPLTYFKGEGL